MQNALATHVAAEDRLFDRGLDGSQHAASAAVTVGRDCQGIDRRHYRSAVEVTADQPGAAERTRFE
jgi:hypothetical protein